MNATGIEPLLSEADRCGAVMITAECLHAFVEQMEKAIIAKCARVAREVAVEYAKKGQITYAAIADEVSRRIEEKK